MVQWIIFFVDLCFRWQCLCFHCAWHPRDADILHRMLSEKSMEGSKTSVVSYGPSLTCPSKCWTVVPWQSLSSAPTQSILAQKAQNWAFSVTFGKSQAQTLPIPSPPLTSPVIHSSEERAGEKGAGVELKTHHKLLVTTCALLLSTDSPEY